MFQPDVPEPATYGLQNTGVVVRHMRQDDSEFVGRMLIECFRGKMEWSVGKNKIPNLTQAMQEYNSKIGDRYHRIFVAECEGQLAGVCQIQMNEDNFPDPDIGFTNYLGCWGTCRFICLDMVVGGEKVKKSQCYVEYIGVDERFRGRGIGKALLTRADEEARAHGCQRIVLAVLKSNRAQNLYLRHGYEIAEEKDGCCFTWCAAGFRYAYRMEKRL